MTHGDPNNYQFGRWLKVQLTGQGTDGGRMRIGVELFDEKKRNSDQLAVMG